MTITSRVPRFPPTCRHGKAEDATTSEPDSLEVYLQEFKDTEHAAAQERWLAKYQAEVKCGNKLLEVEMHLRAEISYLKNSIEQYSSIDSAQVDRLYDLDRQLTVVNQEYLEHQQRLLTLDDEKPPGRLVREFLTKRHRRPSAQWEAGKVSCQRRGGCCARECGCCERWSAIRMDPDDLQHLHCGNDCDCCLLHRKTSD